MNYTGCRPLSEEEIVRLLDACEGRYRARDLALIVMGMHTGFRISERLSLRVKDVWNGSEVAREVYVAKGFMKGKKKARTMPLHEKVRESLLSLLQSSHYNTADDEISVWRVLDLRRDPTWIADQLRTN